MGEEHTMLYYRPPLQEESYTRHNPTIFYPLTRRLEQYPAHLDPAYQSFSSSAQVLDYNQTNANFSREIISEKKNANQRLDVQGFSSSNVLANPGWMQQAAGRNFRGGKPSKTALPAPPSPSLEKQISSTEPERLVQMCSGFGHQDCLLGQDNADFDVIEKGLVSSEEEVSAKSDDLLSTPPMWRKSKDWQKETRGRAEAVRVRLRLGSWTENKAMKRADMESWNEQLMEERMEGVEETMEEMNVERGEAMHQ